MVRLTAGPQLLDIIAACAYLATALQPWIAVILLVTLISYIPLTVYLTEWRGRFRRCVPGCLSLWLHVNALEVPLLRHCPALP